MAEAISLPTGAFAAIKAGNPVPPPASEPKSEAPKTILRKAEPKADPNAHHDEPPADMTPTEKKIWKLKADGEEFEFDASDEEAVKREIMKARGANKRFESAAQMKKQAETFLEMLKDPSQLRNVLTDPKIGIDLKKFAEDYVWEQIQESQLTPQQKAQRAEQRELAELRKERETRQQEAQSYEQRQRVAQHEAHYEQKITKALELGGIPKTHGAVERMANYLITAMQHNLDLSPEELVQQVKRDYDTDFGAFFQGADGDQLAKFLGPSNLEKLRAADLKRLRSTQSNPFPQRAHNKHAVMKQQNGPKKIGGSEWKEDLIKGFLARK